MGCKCPFPRSREEYLVLYHLYHIIRYKEDELLWPFCVGYLVLYHDLLLPPCFYIGIPAGKVSGILVDPGILGGLFPFLFAFGIKACLLPLLYPVIGGKVFSTEKASFDHRHTPLFLS